MKKQFIIISLFMPLFLMGCEPATVGHVYFVSPISSNVYNYSIGSDGSIKQVSTITLPTSGSNFSLATDPIGQYVIATNGTNGALYSYLIGTKGVLPSSPSAISNSPSNNFPSALTIDSTGQYAYVANAGGGDNAITEYAIGANGALSLFSTLSLSTAPEAIVADPMGTYVYVVTNNSLISTYTIGAEGALSLVSTLPVAGAYNIAISPTGQYAYVASTSGVFEYAIGADGGLTSVATPVALTANAPFSIAVDPTNSFVYVTGTGSSSVSVYAIGTDGALTPQTAATGPAIDVSSLTVTNQL